MRSSITLIATLFLAVALRAQSDEAALGRKLADFRFESVALNGDGFFSGDAFLGRPVLYEFWGYQ